MKHSYKVFFTYGTHVYSTYTYRFICVNPYMQIHIHSIYVYIQKIEISNMTQITVIAHSTVLTVQDKLVFSYANVQ